MVDAALDVGVLTEMLMGFVFQLGFLHRELHETDEAQIQHMIDGFATVFARGVASVPQDKRDTPKRRKQT